MDGLTPDDVAAMREQGDFRAFLRTISSPTRRPAPAPTPLPPAVPERDPDRKPGAWPAGTSRPAPPPDHPDAAWAAALDEYRAFELAGRPRGAYRCECGACPKEGLQ